jgi:zinc and cadmium transporter
MSALTWIVASGLLMSAIALVGSITLILPARALDRLLLPLVAYAASFRSDLSWLIPFAAGNFIYIAAADLVPEVNKHGNADIRTNLVHLVSFMLGLVLLLVVAP